MARVEQSTPRSVLVERSFEVPAAREQAWSALADVESWPRWAPHIAGARVSPPGALQARSSGTFRFRPIGRSRFTMTAFDPPLSWTWTGRVMGVTIDYEHRFEPVEPTRTRMVWTVRNRRSRLGVRERLFSVIYGRLIDRAWPRFVSWLSARPEG
jgi:Polyketide cyclase / dehydrase and lipid transport